MTDSCGPLGVLDWGIGGLGFVRELWERRPGAPVVYLSDSGAFPYGKMTRAALSARVALAVDTLLSLGAQHVVIACNAASSVADALGQRPITAIGSAAVASVPEGLRGRLWVLGGIRTVRSQRYQRALARAGRSVLGRVAQPLSAHVEAGNLQGAQLEADLARILAPIRDGDALLLACTHYPALARRFAAARPRSLLIDPARELVSQVCARALVAEPAASRFVTTGDASAMALSAAAAWGLALPAISHVTLPANVAPDTRDATNDP